MRACRVEAIDIWNRSTTLNYQPLVLEPKDKAATRHHVLRVAVLGGFRDAHSVKADSERAAVDGEDCHPCR
jgi:hypothetical protein